MHGYGYFAWANGDVYSGNWAKGKMSGYGVKTSANGTCEKGVRFFVPSLYLHR